MEAATGGVVILGRGGHARVLAECFAVGYSMLDKGEDVPADVSLILGMEDLHTRLRLVKEYGYDRFVDAIHGTAWISRSARWGRAPQIMVGTIIQTGARLGDFVIVNTGAQIDHDCVIGDFAFIGPGAVILGEAVVEKEAFIGGNATVLPKRIIGRGAIVGAGAVVTKDVAPGVTVMGNPAGPRCVTWIDTGYDEKMGNETR